MNSLFGIPMDTLMVVFSLAFVVVVGAVGALVLLPRMFAHAHFASLDGPLTSCWILCWAAFTPQRASRRRKRPESPETG
jgi:4-amino-4-deoxy-L-arabinose transferase-like glycosyltransferase